MPLLVEDHPQDPIMDLIFTVGAYDILGPVFGSFSVALDDDLPKWFGPQIGLLS